MLLALVILIAWLVFAFLLWTQVVYPVMSGKKVFPGFRGNEVDELKDQVTDLRASVTLKAEASKLSAEIETLSKKD